MTTSELIQTICSFLSILFAALSGGKWYEASKVEMPTKRAIPTNLPGANRVILMGEDYARTLARLNEGLERLDASLEAVNRSAELNKRAAWYAVLAAFWIAVSIVVPLVIRYVYPG